MGPDVLSAVEDSARRAAMLPCKRRSTPLLIAGLPMAVRLSMLAGAPLFAPVYCLRAMHARRAEEASEAADVHGCLRCEAKGRLLKLPAVRGRHADVL